VIELIWAALLTFKLMILREIILAVRG